MLEDNPEDRNTDDLTEKTAFMNREVRDLKLELAGLRQKVADLEGKKGSYRSILEDLPDFVCCFTTDGIITYANAAYCTYINKPSDKVIGTSVFDYLPGQDSEYLREHLKSLSPARPEKRVDYRSKNREGRLRWQQWSLRAVFKDNGEGIEYLSVGRDITTIKHIENGLIDALEKYSAIFESSNDAILLHDGGRIIDCNTAAIRIFRYTSKEQLIDRHYLDFSAKVQAEGESPEHVIPRHIRKAVKRGTERFQWLCRRADNTSFPADVILSPFSLEGRTIIAAVIRDISEQKQAEDALRESEEKYRELIENINDAIFSLNADGTITYTSPAIKRILGYTPDELAGRNFIEFVYPDDIEKLTRRYGELLTGKIIPLEYRLVKKNGKPCWVRTFSRPIRQESGQRIFGIITDITKRKKAEQDLEKAYERLEEMVKERTKDLRTTNRHLKKEIRDREKTQEHLKNSEQKYRYLAQELKIVLDGITDIIILCDTDMNVVWTNKAAAEPLDMPPDMIKDISCNDLSNSIGISIEDCPVLKCINSQRNTEVVHESRDGSIWEIRAYPLREDHDIRGAITIYRNVTERKILEDELQKKQKLESLGTLAGGIAHDFNNILTVILGNVSFAKMLIDSNDRIYSRLGDVEQASLRAKELAGRLLTFSKGGNPLKKITPIETLLRDTALLALQRSDTAAVFNFPEISTFVEIDESQMTQVISNIIQNARQAMPDGGKITISTETMSLEKSHPIPVAPGDYVRISIQDTGPGIERKHIKNIFDPFFTTKNKGYGLGLATAYSIVKKHGGHITASSETGKGTNIMIYLPAATHKDESGAADGENIYAGKGRILFMDDEEFIRNLAESILAHLGYEVDFAREGREAIQKYRRSRENGDPFDLVILDLTVSKGMGGKKCIKELMKIDPKVRAIVSSGYSNDPVMASPRKYGFKAFITKPYNIQSLSTILQRTLSEK